MNDFESAQKLFSEYQKSNNINKLKESLDILKDIIKNNKLNDQKAVNFKNTISKYIDVQIKDIFKRCNIKEFGKDLRNCTNDDVLIEKIATLFSASMSDSDVAVFLELTKINSDYFKIEKT